MGSLYAGTITSVPILDKPRSEHEGALPMKFSTNRILTITLSLLICAAMVMMFVPYYASESDGVSLAAYT